jgi:hypothetical protein
MHTGFRWKNQKERDHYEHLDVDGRIILKWILDTYDKGIDWIQLAQDRDQALVKEVMNLP